MSDFIRIPRTSSNLAEFLVSRLPGWSEAPEYKNLRQYELGIPGVVCGAFAQYVCRLFLTQRQTGDSSLQHALVVIDELSGSSDPEMVELVVTEVLENMDLTKDQMAALKSISGQQTRELIDKWILQTES